MIHLRISLIFFAAAFSAAFAQQQQVDMAAVARWTNAKVVRYHIEGVYQDWTAISHQRTASQGDVTDRLTVDVDWNLRERKLVGQPRIQNSASVTKGLRNLETPCPAPVPKGAYEHFEAQEIATDRQERLTINGTRSFPEASIALECPSSMGLKPSPAKQVPAVEYVAIPHPMMLSIQGSTVPGMAVSADKKSFILKVGGWTWTYSPTLVQ